MVLCHHNDLKPFVADLVCFMTVLIFYLAFQSGKTVISNILSESTGQIIGDYKPTQGCRILEFEVPSIIVFGKSVKADVELWDCSGDHKYVF
jgi:hypothetical protein